VADKSRENAADETAECSQPASLSKREDNDDDERAGGTTLDFAAGTISTTTTYTSWRRGRIKNIERRGRLVRRHQLADKREGAQT
jgi:hypothetical protein